MKSHLARRAHRDYKIHRQSLCFFQPYDAPRPSRHASAVDVPVSTLVAPRDRRERISAEFLNTRRVDQHELPSAFRHCTIGGDG